MPCLHARAKAAMAGTKEGRVMWTASKLSRHCAHHHQLSELNPRPTRDAAAKKGTSFHEALGIWKDTGLVPEMADREVNEWIATMVDNNWSWPDGVEIEVAWGLDRWGMFSAVEEKPAGSHVYVPLNGLDDLLTAGRADACWMAGDVLVVIDWKTGRTQAPLARENLQVNAAGLALAQRFKARAYQPGIFYAREGRWDCGAEVEYGTDDWYAAKLAIETAAGLDDQPHPGDHCANCWERKACSAQP